MSKKLNEFISKQGEFPLMSLYVSSNNAYLYIVNGEFSNFIKENDIKDLPDDETVSSESYYKMSPEEFKRFYKTQLASYLLSDYLGDENTKEKETKDLAEEGLRTLGFDEEEIKKNKLSSNRRHIYRFIKHSIMGTICRGGIKIV